MTKVLAIGQYTDNDSAALTAEFDAVALAGPDAIAALPEEQRAGFTALAYKGHPPLTGAHMDLLPALRELGFGIAVEPQGAFYLYADISAFGGDAFAFCRHFLETEHLAFTPGLDFGRHQAGHHVRFAYTQNLARLEEAVQRIARGLRSWQP